MKMSIKCGFFYVLAFQDRVQAVSVSILVIPSGRLGLVVFLDAVQSFSTRSTESVAVDRIRHSQFLISLRKATSRITNSLRKTLWR